MLARAVPERETKQELEKVPACVAQARSGGRLRLPGRPCPGGGRPVEGSLKTKEILDLGRRADILWTGLSVQ